MLNIEKIECVKPPYQPTVLELFNSLYFKHYFLFVSQIYIYIYICIYIYIYIYIYIKL